MATAPEKQRKAAVAFRNWLTALPDDYIECRDFKRHRWTGRLDKRTFMEVREGACYVESTCERCAMVLQEVTGIKRGYLSGPTARRTLPPEGYLIPKEATGAITGKERSEAVRHELLERAFQLRSMELSAPKLSKKRANQVSTR